MTRPRERGTGSSASTGGNASTGGSVSRGAAGPGASPRLSVVIPIHQEEAILTGAVEELSRALDAKGWDYELILAENGSRDRTWELVQELSGRFPRLRPLRTPAPNYGAALRAGILAARGELILCDEIDLCDVGFHERAVALLDAGDAELVIGSKVAAGAKDSRPLVRRAGTLVINGLLKLALDFEGTDTHGLKAFRREALLPVVGACVVERDLFASELTVRAWRAGLRVVEVPIVVAEKRPPSVKLLRRVPHVLGNLARLVWVIRVRGG